MLQLTTTTNYEAKFNGLNVLSLVATSLATEKSAATQLVTEKSYLQLNYTNNDANLML
jgi:hypothetical protein